MDILEKLNSIWHKKITRREFIKYSVAAGVTLGASWYVFDLMSRYKAFAAIGEKRGMHKALYYQKMGDAVQCQLCPNNCTLSDGQRGLCRVREPVKGELYTLVYELVCAKHVDPIEKKPLFHVLPGSKSFSIATAGCNSRCKFCQNWSISQRSPEETLNMKLSSQGVAQEALAAGCASVAYTYTEPVVFYEYTIDASRASRDKGLINIAVTGGKINPEPLRNLCKYIDAANIDLKAFNDKYLREVCAQTLDNILGTIQIMKENGVWVELTNLIVPTLNDNYDDIKKMVKWVKTNLGPGVPLHFSRFWPQYKLRSLYPTPVSTLKRAREIALAEGLEYVYIGNVPEERSESTICPRCKNTVIKRIGYRILEYDIVGGKCKFCGNTIPGIWKSPLYNA